MRYFFGKFAIVFFFICFQNGYADYKILKGACPKEDGGKVVDYSVWKIAKQPTFDKGPSLVRVEGYDGYFSPISFKLADAPDLIVYKHTVNLLPHCVKLNAISLYNYYWIQGDGQNVKQVLPPTMELKGKLVAKSEWGKTLFEFPFEIRFQIAGPTIMESGRPAREIRIPIDMSIITDLLPVQIDVSIPNLGGKENNWKLGEATYPKPKVIFR